MEPDLLELTTSQLLHIEALFEIALESTDADTVRRAVAGLQATPGGRAYLMTHPLAV